MYFLAFISFTQVHTQTNRVFVFPNSWDDCESSWTGKVMAFCKRPTLFLVVELEVLLILAVVVVVVDEVTLEDDITMFAEMLGKTVEEEEVLLSADSKL